MTTLNEAENVNSGYKFNYILALLLFLAWVLGGMDRMVMNFAVVGIGEEFNLSATQMGMVMSAFFIGYVLMQIPGGMMADKFGPRKILLVIITVWSLFTGMTGLAISFATMLGVRFLFGVGEGSFFSSAQKAISISYPKKQRGKALSMVLVSSGVVAIIAPVFSSKIMASYGWRPLFFIVGGMGLIVLILFWLFLKPGVGYVDEDEAAAKAANVTLAKYNLGDLLKTPMMWSNFLGNFGCYTLVWGLNAWMPKYLIGAGVDLVSAGWLMSIPGIGALLGLLFAGPIHDRLTMKQSKMTTAVAMAFGAILLYMMYSGVSVPVIIIANTVLNLIAGYLAVFLPQLILKTIPTQLIGTATGFANVGGQLGSFCAPIAMGIIIDAFDGDVSKAFWYLFAVAVITFVILLTMSLETKKYFSKEPQMKATIENN